MQSGACLSFHSARKKGCSVASTQSDIAPDKRGYLHKDF